MSNLVHELCLVTAESFVELFDFLTRKGTRPLLNEPSPGGGGGAPPPPSPGGGGGALLPLPPVVAVEHLLPLPLPRWWRWCSSCSFLVVAVEQLLPLPLFPWWWRWGSSCSFLVVAVEHLLPLPPGGSGGAAPSQSWWWRRWSSSCSCWGRRWRTCG